MNDTSAEAAEVVRRAIRARPPIERMRDALALSETVRSLSLKRLHELYPGESTLELVVRLTGQALLTEAPALHANS